MTIAQNNVRIHREKKRRKNLLPTGSTPGKLYGLIKVQKEDNPARPVVSTVALPNTN